MSIIRDEHLKTLSIWDDGRYLKRFNLVLTARSLAILFFVTYLISGPIVHETDIIASVVALALFACITLLFAITLLSTLRVRNRFALEIIPPSGSVSGSVTDEQRIPANEFARFAFRMPAISVFPGFVLRIRCNFTSPDATPIVFQIYGAADAPRLILQDLKFPHRGIWKLASVTLEYGDRLELTHFEWEIPREDLNQVIRISVKQDFDTTLPVISSSSRPGDLMQDVHRRQGDYFDLKRYNPADGMRRILWKIYAKSGELVSRHPEASMTPEGEVVIFTVAAKNDDHVCSACLAYIQKLEQLDLSIFFSCEGAPGDSMAHNADDVHNLLVESVWRTAHTTQTTICSDLERLLTGYNVFHSGAGSLQRVLIFCSEERLCSEAGNEAALALGQMLESRAIKPVFCVTRKMNHGVATSDNRQIEGSATSFRKVGALLWRLAVSEEPREDAPDRQLFSRFLLHCSSNDWQVYQ